MKFLNLRVSGEPVKAPPSPAEISASMLTHDATGPISIRSINHLHENVKRRIYRGILPASFLADFSIDPIMHTGHDKRPSVEVTDTPESGLVKVVVMPPDGVEDPIATLELSDNTFNSIDLNLLVLNNPESPRFATDVDSAGQPTMYGTVWRNLGEEQKAMGYGLAPGQIRSGISASKHILNQLETFLAMLGHRAYYLEPLTYASAWVFERRGFAYVRGHKLMDTIHAEFQPGGRLHVALDSSSPFRQSDQWKTVRGRAWAIHDGILDHIDERWNNLRMVKQLGKSADVVTFSESVY
jgi:hypothetical protein